jgi:hypothetical protein
MLNVLDSFYLHYIGWLKTISRYCPFNWLGDSVSGAPKLLAPHLAAPKKLAFLLAKPQKGPPLTAGPSVSGAPKLLAPHLAAN